MKSTRRDIVGQTFNSWKVIEYIETVKKVTFYKCLCLECNIEYKVDGRNVRLGMSKRCRNCGFKNTSKKQQGQTKSTTNGKKSAINKLYSNYKKGAKRKNLNFNISLQNFESLIFKNCSICDVIPNLKVNPLRGCGYSLEAFENGHLTYNGIDRIDSTKGYEPDNVATCCKTCNYAKNNLSMDEFKTWLERAYKHLILQDKQ